MWGKGFKPSPNFAVVKQWNAKFKDDFKVGNAIINFIYKIKIILLKEKKQENIYLTRYENIFKTKIIYT